MLMRPSMMAWNPRRHGSITPLACILLPLMLGMVAFAVDTSWLALTRSELQNAADAAALAGANRLGDNYVLFSLATQSSANKASLISSAVSTAKSTAKTYAANHIAGGVSLTLLDSDIDVGNTTNGTYVSYTSNANLYPNTIKVTMRRDSTNNTSLSMFFAPVIGVSKVDVKATATAMAYGSTTVDSFTTTGTYAAGFLPVAFDVNNWNNFINGVSDGNITTSTDSSGNPTLQVYPSVKTSGNFGWISLNDSHVGASTLRTWITDGPSNSDIQALINANLIPLSKHNANSWDWQAETGFKASNVQDVNDLVGKTFVMPLFKPVTAFSSSNPNAYDPNVGNGSNTYYNIVKFVGVKIMQPSSSNREIMVQPVPITDPTMVLGSNSTTLLSGSGNTSITALAPPKLTN